VYCAPGNAGTALEGQNVPIEPTDVRALLVFAKRERIDLTVVGPEDPLVGGIVDKFQQEGLRIFGPRKDAAELEGSKIFAKDLMRQAGIPTADYRVFRAAPDAERYVLSREVSVNVRARGRALTRQTAVCRTATEALEAIDRVFDPREILPGVHVEIEGRGQRVSFDSPAEAREYVLTRPINLVVKADGLAAGKGVVVCRTVRDALTAIDRFMVRRELGRAGDRVILEERLDGQEASILALTDGRTIVPLETSQDHKRALENDEGPNTGGMGAFSPTSLITPELMTEIEREILVPAVHALKRARRAFRGVLYAGLILTNQGPKVLEFNVRFGDPECQALLIRLKSDLLDALEAVIDERLDELSIEWDPRPGICVVMASEGYPDAYEKGKVIYGLNDVAELDEVQVFHAGTTYRSESVAPGDKRVVTDGGRVLGVTAVGNTLEQSRERAYRGVKRIRFAGGWYRSDIGVATS
jgi:phosphoribosylamine--glycine ligase